MLAQVVPLLELRIESCASLFRSHAKVPVQGMTSCRNISGLLTCSWSVWQLACACAELRRILLVALQGNGRVHWGVVRGNGLLDKGGSIGRRLGKPDMLTCILRRETP